MTPRLEMRHGQSLVMTPQLQQSIKLVQLNNIELSAFIDGELEKNPLLERQDGAVSESESPEPGDETVNGDPPVDGEPSMGGEPVASDSALVRNADDYWSGGGAPGGAPSGSAPALRWPAARRPGARAGARRR